MTNAERLASPCPRCHAKPGDPCVDPLGDSTPRPHKVRGPGQYEKHIQEGIDRRAQRHRKSYGPLFQHLAEAEAPRETVESVKLAERFGHAFAAELSDVHDQAMNGLEWIRLQHIRRELAGIVGGFWAEELCGYALRVFRGNETYVSSFLANALCTDRPVRLRVELRNDPARARTTFITNIRGEQIPLNINGEYLHDTLVWPPLVLNPLPVMTRTEWDARFPRVDREPEPARFEGFDDGGLFERTVAALRRPAA